MMKRSCTSAIRTAWWLPVAAVMAVGVCVAALGLHSAEGWHHHGELGAGLFHLHFHVGHHHHGTGTHGHHHGDQDEAPTAPHEKYFSVAQAAPHAAPIAPETIVTDSPSRRVTKSNHEFVRQYELPADSNPRAPPA